MNLPIEAAENSSFDCFFGKSIPTFAFSIISLKPYHSLLSFFNSY